MKDVDNTPCYPKVPLVIHNNQTLGSIQRDSLSGSYSVICHNCSNTMTLSKEQFYRKLGEGSLICSKCNFIIVGISFTNNR